MQMFFAHVIGGEKTYKGGGSSGAFHVGASVGLFALHQADCAHNIEAKGPRRLDGLDDGVAGGANVIHDKNLGALLAKALDLLLGAVDLFRLTHDKGMNEPASRFFHAAVGDAPLDSLRA